MITPTTEVNIWNHAGDTVAVKLITLTAWKHALASEVRGYQVSAQLVGPIVRDFLGCPDDYPLDMLSDHISKSLRSCTEQMGI